MAANTKSSSSRKPLVSMGLVLKIAALAGVAAVIVHFTRGESEARVSGTTHIVKRGNLPIVVVEGGEAKSLSPYSLKCEVKSQRGSGVKIISLVEEGHRVTKEDIANRLVLVSLDTTELEERIVQHELQYQSAIATLSKAEQDYEIQEKENEKDIKEAEREVKFQAMDLQKFLGETLANRIMAKLHLRRNVKISAEEALDALHAAEGASKQALMTREAANRLAEAKKLGKAASGEDQGEQGVKEKTTDERRSAGQQTTRAQGGEGRRGRAQGGQGGGGRSAGGSGGGRRGPGGGGWPGRRQGGRASMPSAMDLARSADAAEENAQAAMRKLGEAVQAFAKARVEAGLEDVPELRKDGTNEALLALSTDSFVASFTPFDFQGLSKDPTLEGQAEQKLSDLGSDIIMAVQELDRSNEKLRGTERLHSKKFVTDTELKLDEMEVERREINLTSKRTSRDLYLKYEFPKNSEEFFADYEEALLDLDRDRKVTVTKLMNLKVNVDSAMARYKVQEDQRNDNQEQLTKCVIYADTEGLVVFGDSGGGRHRWGRDEPIAEGSTVEYQQTILTIPDITQMAVEVSIHESVIEKVRKGQKAKITVEAFLDDVLDGEVTKVSVLPSSENSWLNPDLKVYDVTVSISGVHDWLKPGMTTQVEIQVETLKDIMYVPLQAVSSRGGGRVCYLIDGSPRQVKTGKFNDQFIEITQGLEEGDEIYLRALEADTDQEDVGLPDEAPSSQADSTGSEAA